MKNYIVECVHDIYIDSFSKGDAKELFDDSFLAL